MPHRWKLLDLNSLREALTTAELHVLALVDFGLSNQEIGDRLEISVGTVKWHLHHVLEKLQARNRIEAVAKAREHGILPMSRFARNPTLPPTLTSDR